MRLQIVRIKEENGTVRECRGLKYCASQHCESNPIKVRDALACQNIFRKGEASYPDILNRATVDSEHYWDPNERRQYYDIDRKKIESKVNAAHGQKKTPIGKTERRRRGRRRNRKNRKERIERLAEELQEGMSNMAV